MKTKLLIALFGLLLCLGGSSCVVHRHAPKPPHKKEIPPGHAKKIRGKKSAKFDAPGHLWGIERSGFFNGREKWAKGFENQRV